jgi:hypothetical protein
MRAVSLELVGQPVASRHLVVHCKLVLEAARIAPAECDRVPRNPLVTSGDPASCSV